MRISSIHYHSHISIQMTVLIFKPFIITLSTDVITIWLSSETKNLHFRIQELTKTVLEWLILEQIK